MSHHVFITGGAGYKGCVLVPKLLDRGYRVTVYDLMLFGRDGLPSHPNLTVIEGDIRRTGDVRKAMSGVDTVIHMACISNDPSFELNPNLSKSINFDCFEPLVQASRDSRVSRFIYVSTSSVYGVSDAPEVTEDHPLIPITDYNKYKGMCEPILRKFQADDFTTVTVRPATVCGYSPRMRLDLTVNILTNLAVNKRQVTVFGGSQKRPNIHIEDITDLYADMVDMPTDLIAGETFNCGYENHTVAEIAQIVKDVVEHEMPQLAPIEVITTPSDDLRSYHISSKHIADKLGFVPKHTLEDAVRDLCIAFREGKIPNSLTDDRYVNVRTVKKASLV
jgi:nucleoside-diphosphate-sugar epimerase